MTKRTIENVPTKWQAFIWFLALLIIPFAYVFRNGIESYLYDKSQCSEPRRRQWKNYSIPIPPGYSVHGLDISHYQCDIDWEEVKRMNENGIRIQFAFIRATRGFTTVDYKFDDNWEGAKNAGILRGAYHFYFFNQDPIQQAQFFLKHVSIKKGDLPPVLDVEFDEKTDDKLLPKDQILRGIASWLTYVEQQTGVKPIIYTNLDYYKRYINGIFPDYKIWIANYNNPRGVKLPDGKDWSFWQISSKVRCNGISELADFNVFNGSRMDLEKLLKK
jgi:lysozyme